MEIWKDIYFIQDGVEYDYRGKYQISNLGNVKSLKGSRGKDREKILKGKNHHGYLRVKLCKNGKQKYFRIHRLVAHLFVKGYFDGAEVNHIDENKENNNANNLEWCSHKHNMNYGTRTERSAKAQGKKVIGYSLTETKVIILKSTRQGEKFGFDNSTICKCCNGKRKSHKGYIWRYVEED